MAFLPLIFFLGMVFCVMTQVKHYSLTKHHQRFGILSSQVLAVTKSLKRSKSRLFVGFLKR